MAGRAHLQTPIFVVVNQQLRIAAGATVTVYEADGVTLLGQTMYLAATGGTTRSNPLQANSLGSLEFWTDWPQTVVLSVTYPNADPLFQTAEIEPFSGTP